MHGVLLVTAVVVVVVTAVWMMVTNSGGVVLLQHTKGLNRSHSVCATIFATTMHSALKDAGSTTPITTANKMQQGSLSPHVVLGPAVVVVVDDGIHAYSKHQSPQQVILVGMCHKSKGILRQYVPAVTVSLSEVVKMPPTRCSRE